VWPINLVAPCGHSIGDPARRGIPPVGSGPKRSPLGSPAGKGCGEPLGPLGKGTPAPRPPGGPGCWGLAAAKGPDALAPSVPRGPESPPRNIFLAPAGGIPLGTGGRVNPLPRGGMKPIPCRREARCGAANNPRSRKWDSSKRLRPFCAPACLLNRWPLPHLALPQRPPQA